MSSEQQRDAESEAAVGDAGDPMTRQSPTVRRDGGMSSSDAAETAGDDDDDPDAAPSMSTGADAGSGDATPPSLSQAREQAGWSALVDWAGLPVFGDSTARLYSTHQRGEDQTFSLIDPGNKDFNSFLAVCGDRPELINQQNDASVACGPGEVGYLVAADDGPGYVSRILLARGVTDPSTSVVLNARPTEERIRVYIDGASTPVFEGLWSDWANAQTGPFDAPLTAWTSGGVVSYLPISYSEQIRVFVDELTAGTTLYYLQVNTHRVQATRSFEAQSLAGTDARADLSELLERARGDGESWFDQQVALEGAGAWTIWTRDQPGTLQRVELTLDRASASQVMNETVLRLSWDGGAAPIDLPLAALFGAQQVLAPVATLPLSVQMDDIEVRLSLRLPMPFAQGARLELVHSAPEMRTIGVRLVGTDDMPRGEWGRLRTYYSEHVDPQPGERFQVAALSGKGKYVGTLLYVRAKQDSSRSVRATELGFMEGDERLEIDGRVAGLGTGTENFFDGGFYFSDGPYSASFAAVSQLAVQESEGTSEATLLRWTILSGALNFQRQFQLSFEFGADRPATVRRYAAVSFYYQ